MEPVMAGIEDFFKGNILAGLAIGVGVAVLAPVVVPLVAIVVKPLAKSAIKGGMILYDKAVETAAEMSEVVGDLVAEAKAELEDAQPAAPPQEEAKVSQVSPEVAAPDPTA
jgi:hypothetical protein